MTQDDTSSGSWTDRSRTSAISLSLALSDAGERYNIKTRLLYVFLPVLLKYQAKTSACFRFFHSDFKCKNEFQRKIDRGDRVNCASFNAHSSKKY
jgi:hypothetical protein